VDSRECIRRKTAVHFMPSIGPEGIVKKLLFPSFTDAGASDAFREASDAFREGESVAGSDAPTEVRDNRSYQNGSDSKSGTTTTESTMSTEMEQPAPPPKSRAFFPSTDPQAKPLKLTARSLSVTAEIGGFPSSSLPLKSHYDNSDMESSYRTGSSSLLGQNFVGSDVLDDHHTNFFRTHQGELNEADDSTSDVNSTASDMGTVVGISSARMDEVNAMVLMTPAHDDDEYEDMKYSPPSINAGLSLPLLDEKENKKSPDASNSATAIVSAAFRRLGKRIPGTASAPTTPKANSNVEDYLKAANYQKCTTQANSFLRSPGSAAHFPSFKKDTTRPTLSPRFSNSMGAPTLSVNPPATLRHANSLASPLRFARGCLSFDNTVDESYYHPTINDHTLGGIPESPSVQDQALLQSKSWDPSTTTTPRAGVVSAFRVNEQRRAFDFRQPSRSHVHEAMDHSPEIVTTKDAFALRTQHNVEIEREDALDILACLVERSVAFEQESYALDYLNGGEIENTKSKNDEHIHPDDDKVSTFVESGTAADESESWLRSPPKNHRNLHVAGDLSESEALPNHLMESVCELRRISSGQQEGGITSHRTRMKAVDDLLRSHTYALEMKRAAKSASVWLRSIGRSEGLCDDDVNFVYTPRQPTNEAATFRSQTFANQPEVEVRDISQSVNNMDMLAFKAMIHSSEQRAKEKDEQVLRLNEELSKCRAEIGRLKSTSRSKEIFTSPNRSILDYDDEQSDSSEDISKANADFNAFDGMPDNMSEIPTNETSFDPSFASGIKQGTRDWSALAEAKKESIQLKTALARANEVIRDLHSKSQGMSEHIGEPPVVAIDNPEVVKELEEYKEALRKAQQLENEIANLSSTSCSEQELSMRSDERLVKVKMLDTENFSTDWEEFASGLPPPPDHDLRSPIVAALLQQWTSDHSMHDSLLSWMERVMVGADPETVPPLTISSLDHQTRDGFSMHIIPMLLKRPDIHVGVKTRAHRRTAYDMAVTVTRSLACPERDRHDETPMHHRATTAHIMAFKAASNGGSLLDESMLTETGGARSHISNYLRTESFTHSSDIGTDSVSHSTVTTHMTNASKLQSRLPPHSHSNTRFVNARESLQSFPGGDSLGDEASVGSSATGASSQKSGQQQSGLMSAIGSTFGGFLSRRSKIPSHHSLSSEDSPPSEPAFLRQFPPSSLHDQQPYHRVVSAPPGRIGVTFVQYRGHAMVSDVAPESPLSGWVFPGDILIAIDEVPVSGMRVRDIVMLLTARKERQRALRVISSHAMTEFTLNQSALSDVVQN